MRPRLVHLASRPAIKVARHQRAHVRWDREEGETGRRRMTRAIRRRHHLRRGAITRYGLLKVGDCRRHGRVLTPAYPDMVTWARTSPMPMNSPIDLHTHTFRSDGTLPPAALVARARAQGVKTLAVTDHDVTDGLPEAQAAADAAGVTLIPGVEISVTWNEQTVHVVGLSIDARDRTLQTGLAQLREFRNWRAQEMDRRLAKKRISGAYDYVVNLAGGSILSRTHFAHFLVAHGFSRTLGEAFKHYLKRGCPGYVPGRWATLSEAVGWIRGSGGVAVIAHPARYRLTSGKLRRLLDEFKQCGGQAIEVISGSHSPADNARFAAISVTHQLAASLGSDYHGPEKPWVELGRLPALPSECNPVWHLLQQHAP